MVKEKISVIVAVYNVEKYIDQCVQSIINQTYTNLEIILVDDGSTDKSGILCDCWKSRDSRIIVLHSKNKGLSSARNVGISRASGVYLGFVDGDDYIASDMYEYLYSHRVEDGIVACGLSRVKEKNTIAVSGYDKKISSIETIELYLKDEYKAALGKELILGSYAWNKLYHVNVFQNIRYPEGMCYEDVAIIVNLFHNAKTVRLLPECKYFYRIRENSITQRREMVKFDIVAARLLQEKAIRQYFPDMLSQIQTLTILSVMKVIDDIAALVKTKRGNYVSIKFQCRKIIRERKNVWCCFPIKLKLKYLISFYVPWMYNYMHAIKQYVGIGRDT